MAPSGYVAVANRPSDDTEREDVAAEDTQDSAPLLPSTILHQHSPRPTIHQPPPPPHSNNSNSLYSASSIQHSLPLPLSPPRHHHPSLPLPNPLTLTFNIPIILRLTILAFAIIAFVLYIIEGGAKYIAAAVFLGILILHSILVLLSWLIGSVCGIFVEVRRERGQRGVDGRYAGVMEGEGRRGEGDRRGRVRWRGVVDLVVGLFLTVSLIVGNSIEGGNRGYYYRGSSWNDAQIAATVFAYLVVLLQAIVATPLLDDTKVTIVLEKVRQGAIMLAARDIKVPVVVETAMVGGTGNGNQAGGEREAPSRESLEAEQDAQILELEREEGEMV